MRTMLALAVAAVIPSGCGQPQQLAVGDAWVRLAAVAGRPAGAYFTLHGGAADTALVGISTDAARRTEMHESMAAAGGGMTMDAIRTVAVPAGATVTFAPAGKHAMLFDVNPAIKPGTRVPLTFTFADGQRLRQDARVIGAGDAPPAP